MSQPGTPLAHRITGNPRKTAGATDYQSVVRPQFSCNRRNMKGIRDVDNDLAIPLLELLRNILVSGKGHGEEDRLRLISILKVLGNDGRALHRRSLDLSSRSNSRPAILRC